MIAVDVAAARLQDVTVSVDMFDRKNEEAPGWQNGVDLREDGLERADVNEHIGRNDEIIARRFHLGLVEKGAEIGGFEAPISALPARCIQHFGRDIDAID